MQIPLRTIAQYAVSRVMGRKLCAIPTAPSSFVSSCASRAEPITEVRPSRVSGRHSPILRPQGIDWISIDWRSVRIVLSVRSQHVRGRDQLYTALAQ